MLFLYYGLLTMFLLLCVFLMLLVLIQKGRGGGLSAAFGGVGGNTAFGAKTGDVLTWATSAVFGLFLVLAIFLNLLANRVHAEATQLRATPAAAATPATAPAESDVGSANGVAVPPVNPTPEPPPTPTTNPSTNPTRALPAHTDRASPLADPAVPSTRPAK